MGFRRALARTRAATAGAVAVAVGGLALAACSSGPAASPAQQVSSWVSSAGAGAQIRTLQVDAQNVDLAISNHDAPGAIQTTCLLLANDAQKGIGQLPTPDQVLTNALNQAYTSEFNAGEDCYRGAKGDASLMAKAAKEREHGAAQLAGAYAEMTAVIGSAPPTTTTTVPVGSNSDPFSGG